MWSRTGQTKEKKPLKEKLSHQDKETCQIQMPILTTASESVEVLHSSKRQRRPSVRLGEIGDLPAAFFTERRTKHTNVVSTLDPSKSNEKTIELERLTQDKTIVFESSKKKTAALEESNKVYIDLVRSNKETFSDSDGPKQERSMNLEKSNTTDSERSKKEKIIFASESLKKAKSIVSQRAKKKKSIVSDSVMKEKNDDLDWSTEEKSIVSGMLKEKSIDLEKSMKQNTIEWENSKKENTIDSESSKKKTISLERNGSLDFREKNCRKTASEGDIDAVHHTIRLADATLSESCLDLCQSSRHGNHEEFLRNISKSHLNAMVPRKNDLEPKQSFQVGTGKRTHEGFLRNARITEKQSTDLSKESPESERNMSVNGHDSTVSKEVCLDIRPSSQNSIGKRNSEFLKNMSRKNRKVNKDCVTPPIFTSVEKLLRDARAINLAINVEENLKDSSVHDVEDIVHSDEEGNDFHKPEGFQDDLEDTSNSGEGEMDLLKPYEEDISTKISKEGLLEQGEWVKGNAVNRKARQEKLYNRETTTLQDGNGDDEMREPTIRDANADHHIEVKRHYSGPLNDGVKGWLQGLGLSKYAEQFEEHEVDQEVLPLLTFDDLKEMGIMAVGSRRKLFDAIQQLARSLMVKTDQPPVFGS